MKLKKCQPTEDYMKCCRFCHYFQCGKCYNKDYMSNYSDGSDLAVYSVVEEGHLAETIEEVLGSVKLEEFRELEYLLRGYKLSEKRIKEFDDTFKKCWELFSSSTLKEQLEEKVHRCYVNNLLNNETVNDGVEISSPSEFVCKYWR